MNWSAPELFIHAADSESVAKAQQLARTTGLSVASEPPIGWQLLVSRNTLQLVRPDTVSLSIDFIDGKATRRAAEATLHKQPLARALGLHKRRNNERKPTVVDATAGLGIDAWMMASLGCSLTLLEQSSVLHALLNDAIETAKLDTYGAQTAHRITLLNTNAVTYLKDDTTTDADIVYLDPMYPASRKQALVKKGMQMLHDLIGPDDNGPALLQSALQKASYRVVVKRPRGAPALAGSESWAGQLTNVESPNTRYDIYHTGTAGN